MEDSGKNFVSTFIILSLGYIGLGLMFLLAPEQSQVLICYLLGGVSMLIGLVRIVFYFMKDDLSRAFQNDLAYGVVLLIAGIYLFSRPQDLWNWIPILLGFAVVFDSIIKLQQAFDLKRGAFKAWWLVLIGALATLIFGVLLIMDVFGGNLLFYFLGAVLIADGLINLISVLLLSIVRKKVKKLKAANLGDAGSVTDVEYTEVAEPKPENQPVEESKEEPQEPQA